jgi:UDP-N-acetylmuramoyl-tripeptide--D-alanyl-D-alanine ligase
MTQVLWTWDELVGASGGTPDGVPARRITGLSIDTRTLQPGDVFVAIADTRDGHEFVGAAFAAGASAALVAKGYQRKSGDGALIRVVDPLAALKSVGSAARARTSARVIAVTGSVGKTGTKDALRACLSRLGATHAAEKSFNNQWGVPLTLARMPAATAFGAFEIGMNHAGEIGPLARLVRPHVAVITAVESVHLGHFASMQEIAEAKAEIFYGLEPGGTAILNRDNHHFQRLNARAVARGMRVVAFGQHPEADIRLLGALLGPEGSDVEAELHGRRVAYRLGAPGVHLVQNSLAVLGALAAVGADVESCATALATATASAGRGARTLLRTGDGEVLLIDESYNANPASMRAALATLAIVPRTRFPRRIAVLGEMLELGPLAPELHRGLKEAVDAAGVDLVFACGPYMAGLFTALDARQKAHWAEVSGGLEGPLLEAVSGGDVIMIKGSLGSRMAPLVEALKRRLHGGTAAA